MSYPHLREDKISKAKRVKIDKNIFNAALELAHTYFFQKNSICELKVKDVFDGKNILPQIKRGDGTIKTSAKLQGFFAGHLKYLKNKYSDNQEAPLFPEYYGKGGEKKFQRNIKIFSSYTDFHDLIRSSYRTAYDKIFAATKDRKKSLSIISDASGKSAREIEMSLFNKITMTSSTTKREEREPFIALWDEIVVLPKTKALDILYIRDFLKKGFSYLDDDLRLADKSEAKNILVRDVLDRVITIEKELPTSTSQAGAINQVPSINQPIVNDVILKQNIDELCKYITKVKSKIPPDEWQALMRHDERVELSKINMANNMEEDKAALKNNTRKTMFLNYQTTNEERKKKRREYIKDKNVQIKPDINVVINNAKAFIKGTGLLEKKVALLCFKDVVKSQYCNRKTLQQDGFQIDWVVDQITGSSSPLTEDLKKIIVSEIEFLNNVDISYRTNIDPNAYIFPDSFKKPFSTRTKKETKQKRLKSASETKQPKSSPETRRINRFKKRLQYL